MKRSAIIVSIFAILLLTVQSALAQDPTKVDPKRYKVAFENDQVRVLRITYGPGEESVMHYHPEGVSIMLDDFQGSFTLPDGKTVALTGKPGDVAWVPAGMHQPKNTGNTSFQVIQVELKDNSTAVRGAIEAAYDQFKTAFNNGNAAGVAALYTENATLMPPNSETIHGKQGIQEYWNAGIEMGLKDLKLTIMDVKVSGDTAYESGKYTIKVPVEGQKDITDSGKYLVVWKRQDDGAWKMHSDIWNSSMPLPQAGE